MRHREHGDVTVETDEGITGVGQINKTPLKEIAEIAFSLEDDRDWKLVERWRI